MCQPFQLRPLLLLLLVANVAWAGFDENGIWNDSTRIQVLRSEGGAYGFSVLAGNRKVCDIELTTGRKWVAKEVKTWQDSGMTKMEMRKFDTTGTKGTPRFGEDSFIRIILNDKKPFPTVQFSLNFQFFDSKSWQQSLAPIAPLYYLRCTPPKSTMFYIGGGYIPSPQVEEFPLKYNKGKMTGEWSEGWSYAPAMASWAVPAVGLWDHKAGTFVCYDFTVSRHTDRTEKYIASAYCYGIGDHAGQFFTLVHPYQIQWTKLTYPKCPSIAQSQFDILYSFEIPSYKDPNMFVLTHTFENHQDLFPEVSRMNDIGWIPQMDSWNAPYGLGPAQASGINVMGKSSSGGLEGIFINPGTTMLGNRFIADGMGWVRYQKNKTAMRGLKDQLKYLMQKTVWLNIDGDTCCTWKHPLEGPGFKEQFGGKVVDTLYNEATFDIGTAMIFAYVDKGETQYLPYIDGVYNWTRHFLFTRNGVCDLPWAMFCHVALSGGENFMLNYRKFFRNDSVRGKNYDEALQLAKMCLYKAMWIYTVDPDETDLMDPAFLIQAVNSDWWIGKVTWNECGWIPRVMIPIYCETGDPLLKYLLRGVLDRFWMGYKADAIHVEEDIEIFGEKGPKGERTGSPFDTCMLGNCRRWAYPVGDAVMRVDVGEKAAIAFCKDTRDYDVENYYYEPEGNFSLKVISLRSEKPSVPIDIIVTAPFKDLREKRVYVNGVEPDTGRYEFNNVTEGEDIYLWGVKPGDIIQVGELKEKKVLTIPLIRERKPLKERLVEIRDFKCLNLYPFCNGQLEMRWWNKGAMGALRDDSWFGYVAGEHFAYGIPFIFVDPLLNQERVFVQGNPASPAVIPIDMKLKTIVFFFGCTNKEFLTNSSAGRISIEFEDGKREVLEATDLLSADITNGLPIRNWNLYVLIYQIAQPAVISKINVEEGRLFALTLAEGTGAYYDSAIKLIGGMIDDEALKHQLSRYYVPRQKSSVDWQWWNKFWQYRTYLEVDARDYNRKDAVVKLKEDLGMLAEQTGMKEEFDLNSVRVVEYDSKGKIFGEVPVQLDLLPGEIARGELVFIMPGKTSAGQKRFFYLYLDSKKSAKKKPATMISISHNREEKINIQTGKGGVEFEFVLSGDGVGPRLMNVTFDLNGTGDFANQPNALGPSGYSNGYADMTAVQDAVCWYNFGGLQSEPAKAEIVNQGSASVTIKISNKEIFGAGDEIGAGPTAAGRKGVADWYFQFYTGKPEFDSWIDYRLDRPDTKWTRPFQVRYGLNSWSQVSTVSSPKIAYVSNEQVAIVPLDEEMGREDPSVIFTPDGNVIQITIGDPKYKGQYFTDKWRTLPAMNEEDYIASINPLRVTQYALETSVPSGIQKPELKSVKAIPFTTVRLAQREEGKIVGPVEEPKDILNPDFSFENKELWWSCDPVEYWYYGNAHTGKTCARLAIGEGGLALVMTNAKASYILDLKPNTTYKVSFWAQALNTSTLTVNFFAGGGYDFKQIPVKIKQGSQWVHYEAEVPTGKFPKGSKDARVFVSPEVVPCLRLWVIGKPAEVLLDDVEVREKK